MYVDSQGCRRWVPVSKTATCHCLRSKVMIKTQVYVHVHLSMNTVFEDLKASIVFSVGEYWQFKQHFLFSNLHLWEAKI